MRYDLSSGKCSTHEKYRKIRSSLPRELVVVLERALLVELRESNVAKVGGPSSTVRGTPKNGAGAWSRVKTVGNKYLLLAIMSFAYIHRKIWRNCPTGITAPWPNSPYGVTALWPNSPFGITTLWRDCPFGLPALRSTDPSRVTAFRHTCPSRNCRNPTISQKLCPKFYPSVSLSWTDVLLKDIPDKPPPISHNYGSYEIKFRTTSKKPGANALGTYVTGIAYDRIWNLCRYSLSTNLEPLLTDVTYSLSEVKIIQPIEGKVEGDGCGKAGLHREVQALIIILVPALSPTFNSPFGLQYISKGILQCKRREKNEEEINSVAQECMHNVVKRELPNAGYLRSIEMICYSVLRKEYLGTYMNNKEKETREVFPILPVKSKLKYTAITSHRICNSMYGLHNMLCDVKGALAYSLSSNFIYHCDTSNTQDIGTFLYGWQSASSERRNPRH